MLKKIVLSLLIASVLGNSAEAVRIVDKDTRIDLRSNKVAHVTGVITDELADTFTSEVAATIKKSGPRIIVINSPGGELDAGNRILNIMALEKAKGTKLICVVKEAAHSMAFNILTHCDLRLSVAKSTMVVHKVAVGGLNPFIRWTAANLQRLVDDLIKADEPFRQSNAIAMHLTVAQYDHYADLETRWTAETLLILGYLDGIVTYADK